jgi:hypothetical protein
MKNPHAVALGQKGGRVKSEAKAKAARLNGAKRAAKVSGASDGGEAPERADRRGCREQICWCHDESISHLPLAACSHCGCQWARAHPPEA